jgi:hypothetical protein
MAQAVHVTSAIGALTIGASTKPSTSPVRATHAEFVAALAGQPALYERNSGQAVTTRLPSSASGRQSIAAATCASGTSENVRLPRPRFRQ